jgi:hypothetical protein
MEQLQPGRENNNNMLSGLSSKQKSDLGFKIERRIGLGGTHQLAVLESIKHLKIATNLLAIQLGNIFPESINTSQCQQPV